MSALLQQASGAAWATRRAFTDALIAFFDCYGERFLYWWKIRDERQMIDRVEAQWP